MNWRVTGSILLYGLCLGGLCALVFWSRYRFTILESNTEWYTLLIATVFVALGAWLGLRLTRPKTIVRQEIIIREVPAPPVPAGQQPAKPEPAVLPESLGISQREFEVLALLAQGMSNEEIAAALFVSANTVKTHLSNLYFKLEVKRRTQAVERARQLGLLS